MVITAWVESGTEVRFTARIRRLVDISDPHAREEVSASSSVDGVHAAVDSWLAQLVANATAARGSDGTVTNE
jgi:hypothetical protein